MWQFIVTKLKVGREKEFREMTVDLGPWSRVSWSQRHGACGVQDSPAGLETKEQVAGP